MARKPEGSRTFSPHVVALAVGWGLAGLFLLLVIAAGMKLDRPLGDFTRDPTAVLDGPAYIGVVSSIGAVIWSIGLSACLLAVLVLGLRQSSPFVWGGLFTALLLADDLLLFHEAYYDVVGIPEKAYPILYGSAFLAYVIVFRDFLRAHGVWLLPLAAGLFAVSGAFDVTLDADSPFIVEDGAKLLGIIAWTVFFVFAARDELRTARATTPAEA